MNGIVFYPAGGNPIALKRLQELGCQVSEAPGPQVTHALLPIPNPVDWQPLLEGLEETVTVVGGNLPQEIWERFDAMDLLRDEYYLAQNAAITADCAVQVARNHLPVVLQGCPVLILGWGRIGKCLAQLLRASGARVTVAARKETDLAMLQALGYEAEQISLLRRGLGKYRVIFNTAPQPVLSREQMGFCTPDCVKIELASQPGMAGEDVISARGLPGKMAPESAGLLIARTVLRRIAKKED